MGRPVRLCCSQTEPKKYNYPWPEEELLVPATRTQCFALVTQPGASHPRNSRGVDACSAFFMALPLRAALETL